MSAALTMQEEIYGEAADYRHGSPHLTYWPLFDRLTGLVRSEVRRLGQVGLPLDVLEIGAGHGGYTEPVLAAGCRVTAVEMSRPALVELDRRFGTNAGFRSVFDSDGSIPVADGEFSMVLCVSVLHHIPDYLTFLTEVSAKLAPGGTLVALQDPLWFSRVRRPARMVDRAAYYSWRIAQGELRRGLDTVGRRIRGVYDESNASDMVEYHVVRDGVDELAVSGLLRGRFATVDVVPYWSSQSSVGQRAGDRLGLRNTFGVVARGAVGDA